MVPWVEASIAGYALEKVLTQAQLARVEARLARLWPPGPTRWAWPPPTSSTRSSGRRGGRVACTAVLEGEFGARGQAGAIPAYLGPRASNGPPRRCSTRANACRWKPRLRRNRATIAACDRLWPSCSWPSAGSGSAPPTPRPFRPTTCGRTSSFSPPTRCGAGQRFARARARRRVHRQAVRERGTAAGGRGRLVPAVRGHRRTDRRPRGTHCPSAPAARR